MVTIADVEAQPSLLDPTRMDLIRFVRWCLREVPGDAVHAARLQLALVQLENLEKPLVGTLRYRDFSSPARFRLLNEPTREQLFIRASEPVPEPWRERLGRIVAGRPRPMRLKELPFSGRLEIPRFGFEFNTLAHRDWFSRQLGAQICDRTHALYADAVWECPFFQLLLERNFIAGLSDVPLDGADPNLATPFTVELRASWFSVRFDQPQAPA